MRYSAVVLLTTVAFIAVAVEARYKRKLDSDFVFAEEVKVFFRIIKLLFNINNYRIYKYCKISSMTVYN